MLKKSYADGIIENPISATKKYDDIIVAVAHHQFKELQSADYLKLSNENPVIVDIKGIVENPSWRL